MLGEPSKIILHCPLAHPALLNDFVEAWLTDGVELIAVFGPGSEDVHDLIDDIVVQDGSGEPRFVTTTWHDDETLSDVIDFATTFGNTDTAIKQIRL
jgi:hypothetical protein